MLDVTETANSSHVSSEAVAPQKVLVHTMKTVFSAFSENFQNLHRRTCSGVARVWARSLTCYYAIFHVITTASMDFKAIIVMCSLRRRCKRFAILPNLFKCVENVNISFDLLNSFPPDDGGFALA